VVCPNTESVYFPPKQKQTTAVTTDAKGRLRNGEDMIMKYGITTEYFVINQNH
jgi:hypothetical protein